MRTRGCTIGAIQALDMIEALRAAGVDMEAACRGARIDGTLLRRHDARVSSGRILALLADAQLRLGDPRVGLHAGERAVPHDPLVYLLLASTSLAEGARKALGFGPLMISTLRAQVISENGATSLVFALGDGDLAASRHLGGYMLMTVLRALRLAADGPLDPRAVHFCFPDPGDDAEREAFRCPVYFRRPDMRLVFDSRALERAPRIASPLVAREVERLSASLLAELQPVTPLQRRVHQVARALLARNVRPERARVARRLGMSDRTLQRALEREGTTFKHVRNAALRESVEPLLASPAVTIEAAALRAGFTQTGAFSKAFKRWTGVTPSAYRRRLTGT